MYKIKLVKKMLDNMAEANNTIDLNAYSLGLSNMFDELQQLKILNMPAVVGRSEQLKCDCKHKKSCDNKPVIYKGVAHCKHRESI